MKWCYIALHSAVGLSARRPFVTARNLDMLRPTTMQISMTATWEERKTPIYFEIKCQKSGSHRACDCKFVYARYHENAQTKDNEN